MSGAGASPLHAPASTQTVFAPLESQTAFEETVERLGTAIKLGLLPPGERLPAERDLCRMLGIARSTLRQALVALAESGHLVATRGRGGGTFVAERPPRAHAPSDALLSSWQDTCDARRALELGVVVLACERASGEQLAALDELILAMDDLLDDFAAFRQADVRFHVGLAEATRSARLVTSVTEAQSHMTDLILHIAHPRGVLEHSNGQHARLVRALRRGDPSAAMREMNEHVGGTEQVLAGLLP